MSMRRLTAAAFAALAITGIAACGSDDNGDSASGRTSSGSSTDAPKGDAIKLGFICSCSGAQKGLIGKSRDTIQAWAKFVNDNGGLNGTTPVEVIVKDDAGDPAKGLQAAKELVEDDKVIAIVGEISVVDAAWADYVTKKRIPVVGGASPEPVMGENPNFYPSGATLLTLVTGTLAQADGKKTLGTLYCAETPVCAQLVPLAEGIGGLFGLKVVSGKVSGTQPNYTASCLKMKDQGADALFVAAAFTVVQSVNEDCAQQDYKPLSIVQSSTTSNVLQKVGALQGAAVASTNANPYDAGTPAIKEFQEAIEAYEPGMLESDEFAYDAFYPWTGGKLFEAAAKAAKLTADATPDDVRKGLYALKDETLGGIAPPLSYTKGKPYFTPCWFEMTIADGVLESRNNNKPNCLDQKQTAALLKAVGG